MNIYVRYFDHEALVSNVDELITFLHSLSDVSLDKEMIENIYDYVNGPLPYPKRYKIRPRVYFILIKTAAETMEEFKSNKKQATTLSPSGEVGTKKEARTALLSEIQAGWYYCSLTFKRVVMNPNTNKFSYQDTIFSAFLRANSGQECYDKIVLHLKSRKDVDTRSQYPSARGNRFSFEYVGQVLTEEMVKESQAAVKA